MRTTRVQGLLSAGASAFVIVFAGACSSEDDAASRQVGASEAATEAAVDGTVTHLEALAGEPGALWVEASFKVTVERGETTKELEVELEGAVPDSTHLVTVDGELITDYDGEAELELVEGDDEFFPEGFDEARPGSVIRVGELFELELKPLVKLVELWNVHSEGSFAVESDYKVETLGGVISRVFGIEIVGGPPDSVLPILADGVQVGELATDDQGDGELKYSTKERLVFPDDFPELADGAQVSVGDLVTMRLESELDR